MFSKRHMAFCPIFRYATQGGFLRQMTTDKFQLITARVALAHKQCTTDLETNRQNGL